MVKKQIIQLENMQKTRTDTSPEEIYRQVHVCKDAHHQSLLGK